MKYFTKPHIKTITHKALFVSMVLHILLIITFFYFTVNEKALITFKDSLAVSITTVPKQPQSKMKAPKLQQRKTTVFEVAKLPQSKIEAVTPKITVKQRLDHTAPIVAEQPRLENTKTAPDINVNVSTALNKLRQVEEGLSTVESAQATFGDSLGSKRTGEFGVQRTPIRSTLDVAGQIGGEGDEPTDLGDFIETKPKLPKVTFSSVMKTLGEEIAETSDGGPIDVVFVIDTSGSMGDNINAVAEHLSEMVDVYKSSDIDYQLGLTKFNTKSNTKVNNIEVMQLTNNLNEYKRNIKAIMIGKDENALDAIEKTIRDMRYRPTSQKHIILVTDEPLTSIEGNTVRGTIDLCREFGIHVNVLGLPDDKHQLLSIKTDGRWHEIPENRKQGQRGIQTTPSNEKAKSHYLKMTQWTELNKIGRLVLAKAESSPVDVILFVDGSNSMEDKTSPFLTQMELWFRDWDNALLDYQVGVVRFRMRGSVNMINVYHPPQSLEQTRKIIELPNKLNEDLIQAINEGMRKIKLRPEAQTHLIIVTDEPIDTKMSYDGVIQFLAEKHVIVSVVGTFDGFLQQVTEKTGGVWVAIPNGNLINQTYH